MKQVIALVVFTLAMLVCTMAQQPEPSGGQATPPSSQTPGAGQAQPSAPGSRPEDAPQTPTQQPPAQQTPGQPGDTSQAASQPIIEGCLGGASPNFTLTDKTGTTYKLNFPANANVSSLESHVGESVRVMGPVKSTSIDVSRIGQGSGKCPATTPKKQ